MSLMASVWEAVSMMMAGFDYFGLPVAPRQSVPPLGRVVVQSVGLWQSKKNVSIIAWVPRFRLYAVSCQAVGPRGRVAPRFGLQ